MLDLKQKLKKVISMVKQSEARSKMIAALNVIDNNRLHGCFFVDVKSRFTCFEP